MESRRVRSGGTPTPSRGGQPRTIGEALETFLGRRGLRRAIEDRRIFVEWEDLVGIAAAREAYPVRIERGILWIGVENAPQANHWLYLKPVMLEKIRQRYPGTGIRDIRVLHRPREGRQKR